MSDIRDMYNRIRPAKFENMYPTSSFLANITGRVRKALAGEPGLSHAFLFYSEMPGLGKTTAARILASELNPGIGPHEREDLFKGIENPVCIHINGGEKRKIDDVRDIIDRIDALSVPMFDYNYVFIIDEIHKLTDDAIDALLMPVETLPSHIYVVMTTTDIAKMSKPKSPQEALLSRLEVHQFKPLGKADTRKLLLDIVTTQGLGVLEERIIDSIYDESSGSPRKAVVLLSQYFETGKIGKVEYEEEKIEPFFTQTIDLLCKIAQGGASWSTHVLPVVLKMLDTYAAEEARIKLMQRLFYTAIDRAGQPLATAKLLAYMGTVLREPVLPPQKSDLVMRLYAISLEAISLRPPKSAG